MQRPGVTTLFLSPLAAPLAFLLAYLGVDASMYPGALVGILAGFYLMGIFFVLGLRAFRLLGYPKSPIASVVAGASVALAVGFVLVVYPLNELWAWATWPIVLACPLTALAMYAIESKHDA